MTSDEAKQALKEGKRVGLVKWNGDEYIFIHEPLKPLIFNEELEEVDECIFEDYKDDDWEIVE